MPFSILLFSLSGLAGLVYESVWAGYLKLLVGHASYGQIMSLCVFMGGLALGSHIASKAVDRLSRPWLAYGIVEISVGIGALSYHGLFGLLSDWLWTSGVLEGKSVPSARAIVACSGAALTLPWAILLGATFPLVAAGYLRRHPSGGHRVLGTLYFANSLGGAFGCLLNSFWLVPRLGLPGALEFAALLNFAVGAAFVCSSMRDGADTPATAPGTLTSTLRRAPRLVAAVAFLTGFSSFLYEISWMRMLALELGSSTHSFDIMLSAFLTGLAWGGWQVRKTLERERPRRRLAWAQLCMAAAAAASILCYQGFFEARNGLNLVLRTTPQAYPFAQLFKFASAFLMMGPAAFFAGMTLPLLTSWHIRETGREEGLGQVYAWNTLGSLLGALGGGLVLMPLVGLQWVLAAGAAVDAALGFVLLRGQRIRWKERGVGVLTISVLAAAAALPLRSDIVTSGAFRAHVNPRKQIVYRKDGAASTVSVHLRPNGYAILRNNGKPDASLSLSGDPGAGDNRTQGTLAWAPLSTRHRPYRAVLIGLGSGMTAHYLLGDSLLQSLDVVEIEPAVLEMSRHFSVRNGRIFKDPRMKFWAEDARTFFATHGGKWDLVVSEPSNPWISGVSSLFTREFYRDLHRHLAPDGVLAQWLQSYEFRDELFLSILAAMRSNFPRIALHPIPGTTADVLLLAGDVQPRPDMARLSSGTPYRDLSAENLLSSQVATPAAVTPRMIDMLVKGIVANSDFSPVVDAGAEEAFFVKSRVTLPVLLAPRPSGWFRAMDPEAWDTLREAWEKRWYDLTDSANRTAFGSCVRAHARSGVPLSPREAAWLDTLVPFPAWPRWRRMDGAVDDLAVAMARSPDLPEQDRLRFLHRWNLLNGDIEAAADAAERLLPSVRSENRLFPEVFGTLWAAHRRASLSRLVSDTACWAPLSWPEKLVVVQLQKTWGD